MSNSFGNYNKNISRILIVKHGALGDVVRTSYFAKPICSDENLPEIKIYLHWLTSKSAVPLLRYNPYIDFIHTDANDLNDFEFDEVYSLDDELSVLNIVQGLKAKKIIGANIVDNNISYCDHSAVWFDMGLLSKYGKEYADKLKKINTKSHSEIFRCIFKVGFADINFYNSCRLIREASDLINSHAQDRISIAINAFAGTRWTSKSLRVSELEMLVSRLVNFEINGRNVHLFLLGSGDDYHTNVTCYKFVGSPINVTVLNTDQNILELAAVLKSINFLITSDSLCVHFAISQRVPTVAFFSPTSAAEIECLPNVIKVISTANDYCSYRTDADNSTITSDRILKAFATLAESVEL